MRKKVAWFFVVGISIAMCSGTALLFPVQSYARSVVPIEGAAFDVSWSLLDNLKGYIGKDVFIHLKSGKTLQGYVKAVGNNLVHLEKLAGKDFYDALIRMDEINAIEAKFREMN